MVIGTTNLTYLMIFPSIALMWINYFVFSIGYNIKKTKRLSESAHKYSNNWLLNRKRFSLLLIAVFSILFSIAVVYYYTGQTPIDVFTNLANNISVYYVYQNYFRAQERYLFSITKIPFVLMLFYLKFILFYSYVSFLVMKENITLFEKFYLLIIALSYIYIGVARGTSFEFFELLTLVIYVMFSRYRYKKQALIPTKAVIISLILGSLGVYIFIGGINARGVQFDPSILRPEVNYNPNRWLPTLFPLLATIVFRMYDYFGFGFFYVSKYVSDVWFSSLGNFVSGILPLGYQAYSGDSIRDIMGNLIYIGVRWHPDFALLVNNVGYLGLLWICFLMGFFSKYFCIIEGKSPIVELTNYIILLQMISLPVGNFLFTSSASKLIVMFLSLYWFWRLFINRGIIL